MTLATEDDHDALLIQDRLADLGLRDPRHRHRLLARLRRERGPSESLTDTYARRLCDWLDRWLAHLDAAPLGRNPAGLAAAEATLALSGVAERWPQAMLGSFRRLPAEAHRRLRAALPLSTPPVLPRAMPEQSLAPAALPQLLPRPTRPAPAARARVTG